MRFFSAKKWGSQLALTMGYFLLAGNLLAYTENTVVVKTEFQAPDVDFSVTVRYYNLLVAVNLENYKDYMVRLLWDPKGKCTSKKSKILTTCKFNYENQTRCQLPFRQELKKDPQGNLCLMGRKKLPKGETAASRILGYKRIYLKTAIHLE